MARERESTGEESSESCGVHIGSRDVGEEVHQKLGWLGGALVLICVLDIFHVRGAWRSCFATS